MAVIIIRADASPAVGTGHVMRCLAVAEALRDQGHQPLFAMAESTAAIDRRLAGEGFHRIRLPDPVGEAADLAATRSLLRREHGSAVILDGYRFGEAYRAGLKAAGARVLAWDDLGDGTPLHADIVVNAAPQAALLPYRAMAPEAALLLGPAYAPLRREVRLAAREPLRSLGMRPLLLVTFGGSDPRGLTGPVIEALAAARPAGCRLVAAVGGSNPRAAEVAERAAALGSDVSVEIDSTRMGALMAESGLAVSAGGGTMAELAALAVPTLLAVVADNQAMASGDAAELGWSITVDARNGAVDGTAGAIAARALALWADVPRRQRMQEAAIALGLDGDGAMRIAGALTGPLPLAAASGRRSAGG
ncbi:UDP-2,4-diacetamido-2,4,6-trideoxy-beta-L-altropyranose hydrolase [Azospirillum picis]|uniref:UDP-2,4-diacetamido-2,4, 6-trideoxy-beta-L-altropyranose hydrolase n=1 Tax=Azospirillum picis TaxID=488438 RepID=A0ABU0MGY6_9PROT|nr:UDP-2,4-diacetamido-2,4,6-trideoxy-beta-L-altropyranose hydrolase [Azospirillum picis]MBP2299048.1 UDP-2,4-diacetamido-2,4,6-trideoxy-beta-L-altropyranose hydrolase [Azospirillum picis]MDQ0532710.1 UDP-2,4-diacetamido-2,4,6-trideoxy-beta-L-altropyranose hydrolase [Azospirillum picis]